MNLLTALQLRNRVARNRVMFGPHETNLGSGRSFSSRHLAYYRRRAAGGAGVIVLEEASVHPSDWPYERCPLASACHDGWRKLASVLHEEGATVLAALGHAGGQGSSAYSQSPLWAPSRVPEVVSREVPKSMEPEDIAAVIDGFALATQSAIEAGLDGVEVNAGQYSLIRQFLSSLTNHRVDEYGTDRLRLAREVLSAARGAAGEAIVGLRLSCDELFPWGGISPDGAIEIATALADLIDYLVVVRGSIYTTWATRPDMHAAPGFNLDLAKRVRAALPQRVAVVLQGSVIEVGMAEDALNLGACDAVEMTRAQIADPDLVNKAGAGQVNRIRPCILCNQGCQVRDARNPTVSCVGEPSAGHEAEDPPIEGRSARPTSVVIVGGGPAGMECARVAASRGHQVRLIERSSRLGGMLRVASTGAGRSRLAALADWLEAECLQLQVQVETGREVTLKDLVGISTPVVLCTGSRDGYRDYSVDEGAVVLTARQLLGASLWGEIEQTLPEGTIAIWDPIGGTVAISVAELLSPRRPVILITPDFMVGRELSRLGDLVPANSRLHSAGVRLVKHALLRRVGIGTVEIEDRFGAGSNRIEAVALVDAGPGLPEDDLWQSTGKVLPRAGDAVAPRSIYEAVLEGRRAALQLERQK